MSFLVLYAYQTFFSKPVPKPATATSTQPADAATTAPSVANNEGTVAASTPTATALVGESSERDVRVETAHVIATFTNKGGRLKSWKLKDYRDRNQVFVTGPRVTGDNAPPVS